jgi:hypothetical protein
VHAAEELEPATALNFPSGQARHAVDAVDPVAALYLPATHDVHELCPVELWYLAMREENKVESEY